VRFGVLVAWIANLLIVSLAYSVGNAAPPVVFRVSEPVAPGDVVMLYGGGLSAQRRLAIGRLPDSAPGEPGNRDLPHRREVTVSALQPSDVSLKFILPRTLAPGVFVAVIAGQPVLVDQPRVYWCQPTQLVPGLAQNEAQPGATLQVIGRNFIPGGGKAGGVKAVLQNGVRLVQLRVIQVDKYSLLAAIPAAVLAGNYQLWIHNGFGGPAAWGGGLPVQIKLPAIWPPSVFNIRSFGAQGDNVHDDTNALKAALEAASVHGGGIIFFPAGTYPVQGWFFIPHRVILRGERRDVTWLKWPELEPRSTADFPPGVLYSSGEIAIEHLSLMARNIQTLLRDLSWDSVSGKAPLPDLKSQMPVSGTEHDVFLRDVDFQLLYYAGRPGKPDIDPRWMLNGFGWKNNELIKVIAIGGVRNLEISDCRFVGGTQRILDSMNARVQDNEFDNEWGILSWTDLGGEYIVFERNTIHGASSWRANELPVRNLYIAYNRSINIVSGEREALTFDVNRVNGRLRSSSWYPSITDKPVKQWQGRVVSANARELLLTAAALAPHAYAGLDVLVLDGAGAGQTARITDNTAQSITIDRSWKVLPQRDSLVLLYQLSGECIAYCNTAEDTSVLLQIWGFLYDVTFDANEVERSQGMWGASGWFIEWLNNRLVAAVTFHKGVGPVGVPGEETAESGIPYGFVGFVIVGQITSLPLHFPYVRATVIRGNSLSYGYRVLVMFGYGGRQRKLDFTAARDLVIEGNTIDHSAVGIELDANVDAALIKNNTFRATGAPFKLADVSGCLLLTHQ
jgi:hypothetical protein